MKAETEAQRCDGLSQGVPKSQIIRKKSRAPDIISMLPKIKQCELRKQHSGPSGASLSFYKRGNRFREERGLPKAKCTTDSPQRQSFVLAVWPDR